MIHRTPCAVAVVGLLSVLGCSEREEPTSPGDGAGFPGTTTNSVAVAVVCEAWVAASRLDCHAPAEAPGDLAPQLLIVGGQGQFVQLDASNVSYDAAGETFQADVTVQNLSGQALGTPDGSTLTGVRVFFHEGPTITSGTGTVGVANPDGFDDYTGSNQSYFEYGEVLAAGGAPPPDPGGTSQPRTWRFDASPDIAFEFFVFVEADVMYPNGWVDVTLQDPVIVVGESETAGAVVRDAVGRAVSGRTVSWSSEKPSVATIDPSSGEATGLAMGSTEICGSSDGPEAQSCVSLAILPEVSVDALPIVRVGDLQTCAVLAEGSVWCWGENSSGIFGDGTEDDSDNVPVPAATGLTLETLSLAIKGGDFACGVDPGGDAYCWGANSDGQLGAPTTDLCGFEGTSPCSTTPLRVSDPASGPVTWRMVSTGEKHACGVTDDGTGYCWGANSFGRLGDGTEIDRVIPTPIAGDLALRWIEAGEDFSCGLDQDGLPYCWGNGPGLGQLTPTLVSDAEVFASISAGDGHVCGLTVHSSGYCWGDNSAGQLGDGTMTDRLAPTPVAGGHTFQSIEAGYTDACAIDTEAAAYCWGEGEDGQLGNGTFDEKMVPTPLAGDLAFRVMAPGEEHSCGTTTGGEFYCWGLHENMAIGDGVPTVYLMPFEVSGGVAMQAVEAGGDHSCGLSNSAAHCWGSNAAGQLGDGTVMDRYQPTMVTGSQAFRSISASPTAYGFFTAALHTCAVTPGDAAYCWGSNEFGQLGDGTVTSTTAPTQVSGSLAFRSVSAGPGHTCGVTTTDAAYCWGNNDRGELGNGTTTSADAPVAVTGNIAFQSVAAGAQTCGVSTTGTGYCWGPDLLVSGPYDSSPVSVSSTLIFQSISAGVGHVCGVTTDGDAYCWGRNDSGGLGDGSTNSTADPVPVSGGLSFVTVSAGLFHTCGITTGNVAHCWGDAEASGTGVANGSLLVPTAVAGGLAFASISAGDYHTCGSTMSGVVYCWGADFTGAVGDGLGRYRLSPTLVVFP